MTFSGLLRLITPHRWVLFSIPGLLLSGSLASLLNPRFAREFTRSPNGDIDTRFSGIHSILLSWPGLVSLKCTRPFTIRHLIGSTQHGIAANPRNRLYGHLQAHPADLPDAKVAAAWEHIAFCLAASFVSIRIPVLPTKKQIAENWRKSGN